MTQGSLLFVAICVLQHVQCAREIVPFVTPGLPACYVASTQYETVDGVATLCSHNFNSRSTCGGGTEYYFYCGEDHECCYQDGCPACCTSQTTLNMAEVAGIVTACAFTCAILVVVVYLLAGKFCSKSSKS